MIQLPPFLVVGGRAAELDDGDDENQHEQDHGDGTGVAVTRGVDEGDVVDIVHQSHGGIAGAALGDHVHLVIHLEGGDGQHDDDEEGGDEDGEIMGFDMSQLQQMQQEMMQQAMQNIDMEQIQKMQQLAMENMQKMMAGMYGNNNNTEEDTNK